MLKENQILRTITSGFSRSPLQINKLLESDAEIIKMKDGTFVAVTVDSIVEEISIGLYSDPYLMGWMSVMASISDLSAVGAKPLGILLIQDIPLSYPEEKLSLIQKGISDACSAMETFVLGGDTNNSEELHLGTVAIGIIEDEKIISRVGCKAGDILITSRRLGSGMGYALTQLFNTKNNIEYLIKPQLKFGQIIRKYASSCIDTSDGFFPAICNLMELNHVGFHVQSKFKNFIDKNVLALAKKEKIPDWFFLAGPHGEFELLFTVPKERLKSFLKQALTVHWDPVIIGVTTKENELLYSGNGSETTVDGFQISNLFNQCHGNPETYLRELFKLNQQWKLK